ncbi:hypothetical protein [Vibrio renipiscarius]|uniref:Uncharacterized protein n=1 Tax=Vibrio renipiscarius TaxID=1461322 RepID=A0A0C2NG04_9VIBR|nr:hypothetical protein [Vibrio renipiscarius]KII75295.1 hypothetical protein OJ16_18535 [Vibrio renipiscarius]KII78747.1 hypothetical protein PL18_10645 [Vibrio renipiscarius]
MNEKLDLYKELSDYIETLTSEHGFSTTEVVSEMLFISSELVKSNRVEVQDVDTNDEDSIFDSSMFDDDDDDDDESEIAYAHDDLKYFRSELKKLTRDVEKGKVDFYSLFSLVDRVECFLDDLEDETIKAIEEDYEVFCKEFQPWKKKAEAISAKEQLIETDKRIIHSIASVKSIMADVERYEAMLNAEDLEGINLSFEIKKKCATFRANKKMLDAEVAKETGNINKYKKLTIEAQALLKQDWKQIVGNEDFPVMDV